MSDNLSTTPKWNTTGGHSPYVELFRSLHPISNGLVRFLDKETFPYSAAKGSFLHKPGFPGEHLYLILKGVIRGYRKMGKKEITTWINTEGEIVGSIQNLGLNANQSEEYIQVIEEAELVAFPNHWVETIYNRHPEANIIGRIILEESYRAAEERAFLCRIPSAELRYRFFLEKSPQLVNRISLKYIASYLGMTLETLSRMRNQMAS